VELKVAAARAKPERAVKSTTPAEQKQQRARELFPSEPLPCACVKRAKEQTTSNIPPRQHSVRHWAAITNEHPLRLYIDIDIAAVRNALLDTTRRAQTTQHFGNTQIGTLDPEKENRYPRSMSAASSSQDARKSLGRNTPGRRGRTGNQYFDVGKVGR
jgi:hypothetical protein